jgi:hypothetical protein
MVLDMEKEIFKTILEQVSIPVIENNPIMKGIQPPSSEEGHVIVVHKKD